MNMGHFIAQSAAGGGLKVERGEKKGGGSESSTSLSLIHYLRIVVYDGVKEKVERGREENPQKSEQKGPPPSCLTFLALPTRPLSPLAFSGLER